MSKNKSQGKLENIVTYLENESKQYQNLWNAAKIVLRGWLIASFD